MKVTERNGVKSLDTDAIYNVYAVDAPPSARYASDYSERAIHYMVLLYGETRKRRVYATPIGNVSVVYLKVRGEIIHCESALDSALHRKGN